MPENNPEKYKSPEPKIIEAWMFRKKEELPSLLYALYLLAFIIILFNSFGNFTYLWLTGIFITCLGIYIFNNTLRGMSLRVTRDQLPELYEPFEKMCQKLGLKNVNLYVIQNPAYNAFAFGILQKSVVFHSSLIDDFSQDEVEWVMAHELGHIKAGHTLLNAFIPRIPPSPISFIPEIVFGFYNRNAEYTCDRCAVAVTKNPVAGVKATLKLIAGSKIAKKIDYSTFAEQIRGARDFGVWFAELQASHPFGTKRINHILQFSKEVLIKKS
jgi:Zn-dependent protease with chaperone function